MYYSRGDQGLDCSLQVSWLPAINDAGLGVVTSRGNKGHRMVDLSGIKINSLMNTVASAV